MVVLTPLIYFFLKPTFFILYLQLFSAVRWLKIWIWVGLVLTFLAYAILTICVWTFATPHKHESFLQQLVSPDETKTLNMSVPQSIIGLILDLYILAVPVVGVSTLHLSVKKKLSIMVVFFSGIMCVYLLFCSR
jgi:hypothetical protein